MEIILFRPRPFTMAIIASFHPKIYYYQDYISLFMKRDLLDILACPLCKGDLTLEVFEENEKEIVTGKLCCQACKECYPIEDGIPNMLPPDLRD
jgi:uncharacterized protein YbaR (Trm112 family)